MAIYKNIQHILHEGSAYWGQLFVGGANTNWTVPNGVRRVKIWAVGGGGGSRGYNSGRQNKNSGGGGGGGTAWRTYNVTAGMVFNLNIGAGSGTGPPGNGSGGLGPSNPGNPTVVTPPAILGLPQLIGRAGFSGDGGSSGGAGGAFSGGDGGANGAAGAGGGGGSPRQGGAGGGIGNGSVATRTANYGALQELSTALLIARDNQSNYGDGATQHGASAGTATGNRGQDGGGGGEGVRQSLTFDTRGGSGGTGLVVIWVIY